MSKRNVCVVTGTRAEYGLLYPILQKIQASSSLQLQLIATTMHLSEAFGLTYKQIEADGFVIDDKVENLIASDSNTSMAKSSALATLMLAESFARLHPDVVLLLGDRYETLAAATTAMLMNIPIAHIHGGEITEGAVDEQIRHAITKMSYLHFTATTPYRERIIQMGEAAERVFCCGAPGIDTILHAKLLEKEALEEQLEWKFGAPSALFTYHPETIGSDAIAEQMEQILECVARSNLHVLFTYANSDRGGREINAMIEAFCRRDTTKYKVIKSLGQLRYLSAMKQVDLLIGNSSSGIIEAASFHKPVVNIGHRQKGRLQSGNVIDCETDALCGALQTALSDAFQQQCRQIHNIYGDGNASARIVDILEKEEFGIIKKFVDRKSDR